MFLINIVIKTEFIFQPVYKMSFSIVNTVTAGVVAAGTAAS